MTIKISHDEAATLQRDLSMEEFDLALSQSNSVKAPGFDGLNVGALKNMRASIKPIMMVSIKNFQNSGMLSKAMNSSFIILIPNG